MPSAAFASGVLDGVYNAMTTERDRRDKNSLLAAQFLMQTGRVKDFNEVVPLLSGMFNPTGKAKGGKGGQGLDILAQLINPALQAGGAQPGSKTLGGQDRPSFGGDTAPHRLLFSEDEMQARDEAARQRDLQRQTQSKIDIEKAKPTKGTADKQPTQNPDGKWTIKVRDVDGNIVYEQPANAPKETGALAERARQIAARLGIDPTSTRAQQLAASQLESERSTKQQQATERLNSYLAMSKQALLTNTERYNEMKELFPHVLAAKVLGVEIAGMRPDVIRQTLAKGDVALDKPAQADRDAQKEAQKIIQTATKTAATMAAKQSSILTELGIDDDEATIRRNLIQEMSGGQDPAAVEKLATATLPAGGAKPEHKAGDTVTAKADGKQHKVLRVQADGQLVLGPALN